MPRLPSIDDLPFDPGELASDTLDRHLAHGIALGLGAFSLGLGALEVTMPGFLGRWLGLPGRINLFRAYGLREMAAGVGLLTQRRKAPWLWARVLGDAVDLATLAFARPYDRKEVAGLTAGVAAVLGVTAIDLLCALRLRDEEG